MKSVCVRASMQDLEKKRKRPYVRNGPLQNSKAAQPRAIFERWAGPRLEETPRRRIGEKILACPALETSLLGKKEPVHATTQGGGGEADLSRSEDDEKREGDGVHTLGVSVKTSVIVNSRAGMNWGFRGANRKDHCVTTRGVQAKRL